MFHEEKPLTYFLYRYYTEIASFLLILLFVYAATSKLLDFQQFKVQLGQSPVLSPIATLVAWIIPSSEIVIAFLLTLPRFRTIGLYASFTLLVVFTAYIYTIVHFSSYVPCSCGGILEHMNWNQHFVFNILFIILTLTAILIHENLIQSSLSKL